MRFVYGAIILVVAVLAADLAVSNRVSVELAFWPLQDRLVVPLYLVLLPLPIVGFILGWVKGAANNARLRRERRRQSRTITRLETELSQARDEMPEPANLSANQRATLMMSAH